MASKETDYFAEAMKRADRVLAGQPRTADEKADFVSRLLERIYNATRVKEEQAQARTLFARATSETPRERRRFRTEVRTIKYSDKSLEQAKEDLKKAWAAAELKSTSHAEILDNPDAIKHSAVAAELAARIMSLPSELQNDPKVLYRRAAEAYTSINWRNLPNEQEAELRVWVEKIFDRMRYLAKDQGLQDIPEDNASLWKGLNDFYFSSELNQTVLSTGNEIETAESRNNKRKKIRDRLVELQDDLGQPNTEREERKILERASEDLLYGSKAASTKVLKEQSPFEKKQGRFLSKDCILVREKIKEELEQYDSGSRGGKAQTTEDVPSSILYEDLVAEVAKATGGVGLLDSDINPAILDSLFSKPEQAALKARLLEVRQWLSLEEDGIGEYGGKSLESAQQVLRNMKNDRMEKFTLEQNEFLERCLGKVESMIEYGQRSEQPLNRLYLTPEENIGLDKDPIGTIDRMLGTAIEQIIHDPEGPRAKSAIERLSLMQEYLFSEQYDEKKLRVFERSPEGLSIKELVGVEKQRARDRFKGLSVKQKENFGRSFTIRWHAAQFYEQWSNADSPSNPNFQKFLNERMNEDDFFGLDGLYGSLVVRAREKLRANYEALMFDGHGIKRGYDPKFWDEAVVRTVEQMKGSKAYEDIFNDHYLSGELFKERPFSPSEHNSLRPAAELEVRLRAAKREDRYKDACSLITELANIRMIMSGEKYNLDIRYRTIHWAVANGQTPSTYLEKQQIAKLMRPWEAHMQTWGSFTGKQALEKAQLRHRAAIMRNACPDIDIWAKDWTEDVWKQIERFKAGAMESYEKKALFADIDSIFFFTPDKRKGPPLATESEKMAKWIGKLSKKKLEQEVQVYAGLRIDQQHTMRPYVVMFESGYRRESETKFLEEFEEAVAGVFGSEGSKGVFVASKVVGKSNDYFMDIYGGGSEKKRNDLLEVMSDASHWRPHSMALALREGDSKTLRAWADSNIGGQSKFIELYTDLSLSYDEIRAGLLGARHKQIDYYTGPDGLDEVQRTVARSIFQQKHGDQAEIKMTEHFDRMQKLSKLLVDAPAGSGRARGAVEEFTSIRYAELLSKARWDDYPYEMLQYPERGLEASDPGGSKAAPSRVSDKFKGRHAGEERSGPWRRMWRDFGGAQTVFEQIGPMFSPDPKVRLKAIETAYGALNGYQGPQHATINYLLASGGRLGSEKARFPFNPFFEGLPGNSDMYDYYSSDWKGRSVDELHLELNEDMKAGSGKIVNAPEAAAIHEAVESYLGISSWRKILLGGHHSARVKFLENRGVNIESLDLFVENLNDRLPSGLLKLKAVITIPWALIAFTLLAATQIKEQSKEEGHR